MADLDKIIEAFYSGNTEFCLDGRDNPANVINFITNAEVHEM